MRFAEDRNKIRKIVRGSLPRFVDLYEEPVKRLQTAGVPVDQPAGASDGLWRQVLAVLFRVLLPFSLVSCATSMGPRWGGIEDRE